MRQWLQNRFLGCFAYFAVFLLVIKMYFESLRRQNSTGIALYIFVTSFYDAPMSRNEKKPALSGFDEVCSVLCQIRQAEQMKCLLEEILTPSERKDLALRWRLMQMLEEGVPQRKIASELGISLCKITRGAKILKDSRSVSKQYLESRRKK